MPGPKIVYNIVIILSLFKLGQNLDSDFYSAPYHYYDSGARYDILKILISNY